MQLRQDGVSWHVVGDDIVVLDLNGSMYLKLSGSGRLLWERLAEPVDEARPCRRARRCLRDRPSIGPPRTLLPSSPISAGAICWSSRSSPCGMRAVGRSIRRRSPGLAATRVGSPRLMSLSCSRSSKLLIRFVSLPRLSRLMGVELNLARSAAHAEPITPRELSPRARRQLRCTRRVTDVWPLSRGPCLRRSLVAGPPSARPLPDDPARHGRRRRRLHRPRVARDRRPPVGAGRRLHVRSSDAEPRLANERTCSYVRPLRTAGAIGARPRAAARRPIAGWDVDVRVGTRPRATFDDRRPARRSPHSRLQTDTGTRRHRRPTATTCGCLTAASSSSRPTSPRSRFGEATRSSPPCSRSSWPERWSRSCSRCAAKRCSTPARCPSTGRVGVRRPVGSRQVDGGGADVPQRIPARHRRPPGRQARTAGDLSRRRGRAPPPRAASAIARDRPTERTRTTADDRLAFAPAGRARPGASARRNRHPLAVSNCDRRRGRPCCRRATHSSRFSRFPASTAGSDQSRSAATSPCSAGCSTTWRCTTPRSPGDRPSIRPSVRHSPNSQRETRARGSGELSDTTKLEDALAGRRYALSTEVWARSISRAQGGSLRGEVCGDESAGA